MNKQYLKTEFGEKMKSVREAKGISGNQLSKMLNIAQRNYSNYEKGNTEPPLAIVVKIAQLLNVSTDYLLGLSDAAQNRVVQSTVNGHNVNGSGNVVSSAHADEDEISRLKTENAALKIKLEYATDLIKNLKK